VYIAYTRLLRIPELQQTIDIARSFMRRDGSGGSGAAPGGGAASAVEAEESAEEVAIEAADIAGEGGV